MKDRTAVTCNGKAAFYAAIWNDLRQAAMDCGWALALHGSLNSDMDIMAMPWVDNATTADIMIKNLIKIFGFSDFWIESQIDIDKTSKPNGRVVYTIPIHGDYYLDLNVIENEICLDQPHPEATISGWVARNESGKILFFKGKEAPSRPMFAKSPRQWHGSASPDNGIPIVPKSAFPSLTWQDEPIEVEITIKPNKL